MNGILAEEWPYILDVWAEVVSSKIKVGFADVGLGMPMGGLHWNMALCRQMSWRAMFPDKEVVKAKTSMDREQSLLVMGRHTIYPTQSVVIVEDVCNNFSTTAREIELVAANLGYVAGIICLLNRSGRTEFEGYPIIALVDRVIPEYKQDDLFVAADVATGNLVRKPKDEWKRLANAMAAAADAMAAAKE